MCFSNVPRNHGLGKKKVFPKMVVPPNHPFISILIGFFHYFHHPFWGVSPYFWFNTQIEFQWQVFGLPIGSRFVCSKFPQPKNTGFRNEREHIPETSRLFGSATGVDGFSWFFFPAGICYPLVFPNIAFWSNIPIFNGKYIFNPGPFSSQLC